MPYLCFNFPFTLFQLLTAGDPKLNPVWDDLRNDPRFERIIAKALEPIKLD
jgi:hypothetical protein